MLQPFSGTHVFHYVKNQTNPIMGGMINKINFNSLLSEIKFLNPGLSFGENTYNNKRLQRKEP